MRISKHVQRALAVMLCLSLFAASLLVNPVRVQAAKTKTKNITLYAGEAEVSYYIGKMVKKVSSSNKKVVIANQEDAMSTRVCLTAKKAGKATVTVQTVQGETHKLTVTVKEKDFDTGLIVTENGIVFTSTNNMNQYFNTTVKCTLRDEKGEAFWEKTASFRQLPGKTNYFWYSHRDSILERIDPDKSTVEVIEFHRFRLGAKGACDLRYVYKDVSKKIKSSLVDVVPEERNLLMYDVFEVKLKNSLENSVSVDIYILFYDEYDRLMRVKHDLETVEAKKSKTVKLDANPEYDHYKILVYGVERYKK